MAFGVHALPTAAGVTAGAWRTPRSGLACLQARRQTPPQPISRPVPGCMARPHSGATSGAGLADGSPPQICRTEGLRPTRSTCMATPDRLRRRAPGQRLSRAVQSHAEPDQIPCASTAASGARDADPRLRRHSTMPPNSSKRTAPADAPLKRRQAGAPRLNQPAAQWTNLCQRSRPALTHVCEHTQARVIADNQRSVFAFYDAVPR